MEKIPQPNEEFGNLIHKELEIINSATPEILNDFEKLARYDEARKAFIAGTAIAQKMAQKRIY